MTTRYTFRRGATILIALDVEEGDADTVDTVTASMKMLRPARTKIDPGEPVAATFTVVERPAAGDVAEGWTLSVSAADSEELEVGEYVVDAALTIGSTVIKTDAIVIVIEEPATV